MAKNIQKMFDGSDVSELYCSLASLRILWYYACIMEKTDAPIPIYTIGYGSRSIAALIKVLHQHEIAYLIDVRSAPYSRYKSEFSKAALAKELEQHGIRYVFMGDTLGGRPDDETCYVNGRLDYEKVKEREYYQRGIERLHTAFLQTTLCCLDVQRREAGRVPPVQTHRRNP